MEEITKPEDVNEKGKITAAPGVGVAKVFLGEDHVLRVEIDLKVPDGMEVEGRVGAYGTLKWAEEIVSRFFTLQEMKRAKAQVEKANQPKINIVPSFKGIKAV